MSTPTPPQPPASGGRRYFAQSTTIGPSAAARAVADDASALVQAKIELARAEAGSAVQAKAVGGGLLIAAAAAGWLGLQGLLVGAGLLLALVMPGWAAALIVTALLLLVAAIMGLLARRRLQTPVSLEITKQSIEEDVAWVRAHLSNR